MKEVTYRSAVSAVQLGPVRWQYYFTIKLEDGSEHGFTGIVHGMEKHAIDAGVIRSQKMISKGYEAGM